jgi:hypothetical protein
MSEIGSFRIRRKNDECIEESQGYHRMVNMFHLRCLGGYIPILGWGEANWENSCMHIWSYPDSPMLTVPPSTIETTLESMWKELCGKRKLTDNPPPKPGSKVGDRDQVS